MYTGQIKLIIERMTSKYLVEIGLGLTIVELCHLPMIYSGSLGYTSFLQVLKHDIYLVLKVTMTPTYFRIKQRRMVNIVCCIVLYCQNRFVLVKSRLIYGRKIYCAAGTICPFVFLVHQPVFGLFGKSHMKFETTKISENAPFNQSDPFGLWTNVFLIYKN